MINFKSIWDTFAFDFSTEAIHVTTGVPNPKFDSVVQHFLLFLSAKNKNRGGLSLKKNVWDVGFVFERKKKDVGDVGV